MFNANSSSCLDCWHWQGWRIRCALQPDEPRLLDLYELHGCKLVRSGQLNAWSMWQRLLQLLLDSAADRALPWHWRSLCLDHTWRPLYALNQLAATRQQQLRLNQLRNRLATLRLQPSLCYDESAQGHSNE